MNADKYEKLATKLRELFQLDQPELDFGIYRVMHLKRDAVERYLDPKAPDGLRVTVESVFASATSELAKGALEKARAKVVESFGPDAIGTDGALSSPLFANTPVGKAYTDALTAVASANAANDGEKEVYDLLLDFFSRYYKNGDFVSLRRVTRETGSRAQPYAIPYGGEEVKLHWANADQYYIKTSLDFSSYTVDLSEAREVKSLDAMERMAKRIPDRPMRVHFKIVKADEGEHNNIKPNEDRYFFVDWVHPFEIPDVPEGELTVFFHHEADPEKPDKAKNWQKQLLAKARDHILDYLESFTGSLDSDYDSHPVHAYLAMLSMACPTDGNENRVLLDRYLEQYAARNTEDYFIHKDLGGFLRRELEFYVKNEILNVSDLERQSDDSLLAVSEAQLRRARAFYRVARRIVDDFLAPLEDFQKKLWLKKKFVVQSDWCITLDIVREHAHGLLPEILANAAQKEEWRKLGLPDGEEGDARMVDTKFFDESFKAKLLAAIPDLDARTDGVLVHSENFQALRFIEEQYRGRVKCTYIDPPYNTNASKILYKNGYEHSSWISLLNDRLMSSKPLMSFDGIIGAAIDDYELRYLHTCMDLVFGRENCLSVIAIHTNPKGRDQEFIAQSHDYTVLYARDKSLAKTYNFMLSEEEVAKKFSKTSNDGSSLRELPLKRTGSDKLRTDRPYMYFPFLYDVNGGVLSVIPEEEYGQIYLNNTFNDTFLDALKNKYTQQGLQLILPIADNGEKLRWRWGYKACQLGVTNGTLFCKRLRGGRYAIYQYDVADNEAKPKSLWIGERYDASSKGTNILNAILPGNPFDYPKSLYTVEDTLVIGMGNADVVLDYFGGSGTTAHAVIDLNRQDGGKRKYILVEMGEHFNTVLKLRTEKVVYSPDWKNGKPQSADKGISHCFKYLTLESYEDTLNNLCFDKEPKGASDVSDYLLRYMLEAGTKGSPSLLDVAAFAHPFSCTLDVKKTGSEERETRTVDLVETFNWLIGLRVRKMSDMLRFSADFERVHDPDFPTDDAMKLRVRGRLRKDGDGQFAFRFVEGLIPRNRMEPDGAMDKVLVVWREGTGDAEKDNAVLDAFLQREKVNALDGEYDVIYVNGSNNVPSLRRIDQTWKVQLIEKTFLERMWEEA